MTLENQPFEDVSPTKNSKIVIFQPAMLVFRGVSFFHHDFAVFMVKKSPLLHADSSRVQISIIRNLSMKNPADQWVFLDLLVWWLGKNPDIFLPNGGLSRNRGDLPNTNIA